MRRTWVAAVLTMLVVWFWSPAADACKCAHEPTTVHRPLLTADSSQVRVRFDEIEIRCEDRALTQCTWKQRHHLRNEGGRPAHVTGRLYGALRDARARVEFWNDHTLEVTRTETLDPRAVAFEMPGRAHAAVVVEARVAFASGSCGCWASGLVRRHPVVSRGEDVLTELDYVTHTGLPEDPWTTVSVTLEYPGPGRIRSPYVREWRVFRSRDIGNGRVRTTADFEDQEIAVSLSRRNKFARGGPFVAVGGGWGTQRPLRLRAGYELGAPRWLVHSIAVESDTSDARIVPAVEALTGHAWFPWLPAAGIGVGVPVDVYPRPRVGLRGQVALSWYVVTFLATADYFPAQRNNAWAGSLFAQLSF